MMVDSSIAITLAIIGLVVGNIGGYYIGTSRERHRQFLAEVKKVYQRERKPDSTE